MKNIQIRNIRHKYELNLKLYIKFVKGQIYFYYIAFIIEQY